MNQDNAQIVAQLISIKRWVAVGAIGFLLIGISVLVFSVSVIQMSSLLDDEYSERPAEKDNTILSWESASELFDQGKTQELMSLVEKRLATHPNDSTAYWFKAKVHYLNHEWDLALANLEKAEVLAPSWRKEYTGPLREKIIELRK